MKRSIHFCSWKDLRFDVSSKEAETGVFHSVS
jgi:hypothetical protein